jgi:transposase, IS5 family
MQGIMAKALKNRASRQQYVGQAQLSIPGFDTPFAQKLNPSNRWVLLSQKIPWDKLVKVYESQMRNSATGAGGVNPRVALGALIIKHMCDLSDRETVLQIQENMYMQYFIGLSGFCDEEPFDASLFVEFRKRLGAEQLNKINELVLGLPTTPEGGGCGSGAPGGGPEPQPSNGAAPPPSANKGRLIVDATACPQDIRYPTDLDLLNDAREKSEELIDLLYSVHRHGDKPRTYRQEARRSYLETAQKRSKTKEGLRAAVGKQLNYLRRNIKHIHKLLDAYKVAPLDRHQYKYLLVIQTLYGQQREMHETRKSRVDHRIVSIHQPHVRPIVRGKATAKVEFGAKIEVSIMNGFAFLEELSWEAYNEGTRLMATVEKFKTRFGTYPAEVLADKIYCTRENRAGLKARGISLKAKPLGRPKAVEVHVSPGERNPIEGKFGQAKSAYGLGKIKARLQHTTQSWIASIIMVLNLVKLAGQVPCYLKPHLATFSASLRKAWTTWTDRRLLHTLQKTVALTFSADPKYWLA